MENSVTDNSTLKVAPVGDNTNAIITVRVIKSLPYKNFRPLVFHNVDVTKTTLAQLRDMVWQRIVLIIFSIFINIIMRIIGIRSTPSLKQYENCPLDTFKLFYHAHGAKTNNPMINLGGDEQLVLRDDSKLLVDCAIGKLYP